MNSLVLIVVLSAFSVQLTVQSALTAADTFDADSFGADSLPSEADLNDFAEDGDATRNSLNLGNIGPQDKLLFRKNVSKSPIANQVQREVVQFRGSSSTRIAAIRVREVGNTQRAIPSIRSGGIGQNNVGILITSARGRGFSYSVEIHGR